MITNDNEKMPKHNLFILFITIIINGHNWKIKTKKQKTKYDYENELNERFFSLNSGLESRFVWRFKIDDYSAKNLWEIFKKKVADYKWKIGNVAGEKWFQKRYDSFSGFGRDIETLLFKVKIAHSKRVYGKAESEKRVIELVDLDSGYEIFMKSKENTREYSLKKSQKILSAMFA